jgi:hypothetical protein
VEWEAGEQGNRWKSDDSLRSFLFTLKNPRGVPPRKFALKAKKKQKAIYCDSECGPLFGNGCISVSDNCNRNTNSNTEYFGEEYDSVSGRQESDFLTGAVKFTVKEIEVFEIAD